MSKRLCRIAGVSVLTGVTVLSQSGVASATDLSEVTTSKSTVSASSSDTVSLLAEKYGAAEVSVSTKSLTGEVKAAAVEVKAEEKAEVTAATKVEEKVIDVKKVEEKKEATCPADKAAQVVAYSYTVNGKSGIKSLQGNVNPGDTVKVDFQIADKCDDVELSLAGYDAPSAEFSRDSASKQVLKDSATGKFDAGKGSLSIKAPECFYQVDFVRGGVLKTLGPDKSDNFYADQGRLIDAGNGGKECVVTPPPVETPPPAPVVTPPAPVVEVAGVELAKTGANDTMQLATLGVALLMMGTAMERTSRRMGYSREMSARLASI